MGNSIQRSMASWASQCLMRNLIFVSISIRAHLIFEEPQERTHENYDGIFVGPEDGNLEGLRMLLFSLEGRRKLQGCHANTVSCRIEGKILFHLTPGKHLHSRSRSNSIQMSNKRLINRRV